MNIFSVFAAVAFAVASAGAFAATPSTYSDRASFTSAAGLLLTDTYESVGYTFSQDDAQMSAVMGWTAYTATSHNNLNIVSDARPGQHVYCAGCNGSFALAFTAASLGGLGVYAAGFDFVNNVSASGQVPYVAFVSFADGSTQNFSLQTKNYFDVPLTEFFGITSSSAITRLHIGLENGVASSDGYFAIDNLSVSAPVPEPTTVVLMGAGLAALAILRRRSRHAQR